MTLPTTGRGVALRGPALSCPCAPRAPAPRARLRILRRLAGRLLLGLTAAALGGAALAGDVRVRFVEPRHFADAGLTPVDRERTLQALAAHVQGWGARLPAGSTLELEVLDLDLAGRPELVGHGLWLRVLRGTTDAPRVTLRWTLRQPSQATALGEAALIDLGYTLGRDGGELVHEKRLLDRWFEQELPR